MSAPNRSAFFWGIVLILAGLVFLLVNFDAIPGPVLAWWPVLVIGAGVWLLARVVTRRQGGGAVGAVLLLALGGYWLARNLGVAGGGLFLPVLLIALGVGTLLRGFLREP
jgi:lia operon protein LiaF